MNDTMTKKEKAVTLKKLDEATACKRKELNRAFSALNEAVSAQMRCIYHQSAEMLLECAGRVLVVAAYNHIDFEQEFPTPEQMEDYAMTYAKEWLPFELLHRWRLSWKQYAGQVIRNVPYNTLAAVNLAKKLGL